MSDPSAQDARRAARAEAAVDVMRTVMRHPNLLDRDAFRELVTVARRHVQFAQLALMMPEPIPRASAPPGVVRWRRLYAVSLVPTGPVVSFGACVPQNPEIQRVVYEAQSTYFCDDARHGSESEQMTARAGYLSFSAFPVCSSSLASDAPRRVLAELFFAFHGVGEASTADLEIQQDIADILGENLDRLVASARERRLARILETSSDAMLAWDGDGRVTDANVAAATLVGRPRDELLGSPIAELLDPPPSEVARPDGRMIVRAKTDDGSERRVVVAAAISDLDGDPLVRAHALLRDLTRVVAAEREAALHLARIREIEEQHRTLLDNAPLIIFRLDPKSTELEYLNHYAERLLGVPTQVALCTPGFLREAHADPEGVAAFDAAVRRAQRGATSLPYEARLRRAPADAITARGTVYPLLSERGEVVGIEGVLADVSAEQAARTRLVQNDRLATLGTLAAGVAHEINNPAAFILLGLDMLDRVVTGPGVAMEPEVEASARELLRELRDSIKRIVDIARDLRLFASPPSQTGARRAIVDVNRTVESALSLTRGQILERAELVRHLDDVPPVVMDDGRLGQVVVNLLVNAAQSIQKTRSRAHEISVATRCDGRFVEIEVTDTGAGIPAENLERIWEPFFSTKAPDVGTGLGLAISRGIVERAGGSIRVESPLVLGEHPSGSRFIIALPVAGYVESQTPISSPLPRIPSQRVRVLVVEDEAPLAKALSEELSRLHDVTTASNGERALELLQESHFDVVLCDIRMPGMGGKALFARVVERAPEQAARFIFMTGVGFGGEVEDFLATTKRPVLEKPFSAESALDAILRIVTKRP